MISEEFEEKLTKIQKLKRETQQMELKKALLGCPKRLYDTLSSFSNQDSGGVIIFGVDEEDDYRETGVYDAQDLQKKINEQCLQMEPIVRPLITVLNKDGKQFVAAEIPSLDLAERPCYYKGQGRIKGSYRRIGDSDEPMTEYEVYSYEAFRKKYQDDIRPVPKAKLAALDSNKLKAYLLSLKVNKPNLAALKDAAIRDLLSLTVEGVPSLYACLLFSPYPQAYFPQLCITAVVVSGTEIGELGPQGERFLDNKRIEGPLPDMLDKALSFVKNNTKCSTIVNKHTGHREDKEEYPLLAVRELILNALVHRDYSEHTEGMPIQLLIFSDRLEIKSPGGVYGRISIEQLGKVQLGTRNPALVSALEVMGITENRYSGIPIVRQILAANAMPEPEFSDYRGCFCVKLMKARGNTIEDELQTKLLKFCSKKRTRQEIAEFLGIKSVSYAMRRYVKPLIDRGMVELAIQDRPHSERQFYYTKRGRGI